MMLLANNWKNLHSPVSLQSSAVTSRFCDIFNMSCLGVILQMRGRDDMSIPQNGVAAKSESHVLHICQGGIPLPSLQSSSS